MPLAVGVVLFVAAVVVAAAALVAWPVGSGAEPDVAEGGVVAMSAQLRQPVEHAGQVRDETLGAAHLVEPGLVDLQARRRRLLAQRLAERAPGLPGLHGRALGERVRLGVA